MRILWQKHAQEEDWGLLLIDTRNLFNEENHTAMIWAMRFEWPSGARFAFNCYCHWVTLVTRAGNGTGHFLFSKDGLTQGESLDMVAYGLGTPPLIRELRKAHSGVT